MADNKTTVHGIYDAFGRGDVAGILAGLADNVEWICEGPKQVPFCGTYHGPANVVKFFQALGTTQSEHNLTIEATHADGDTVVSTGRFAAKVNATGKAIRFSVRPCVHNEGWQSCEAHRPHRHCSGRGGVCRGQCGDCSRFVRRVRARRYRHGAGWTGLTMLEWICGRTIAAVPFAGHSGERRGARRSFSRRSGRRRQSRSSR